MDFPQQIEETLVETPVEFDVTMDSVLTTSIDTDEENTPLQITLQNLSNNYNNTQHLQHIKQQNEFKNNIMTSSNGSMLDDTTPSDSGVQLLDSESSELMIESITSQNGFDLLDDKSNNSIPIGTVSVNNGQMMENVDVTMNNCSNNQIIDNINASDLENSNVQEKEQLNLDGNPGNDIMTTSNCSTFDTTENIVYRRKTKNQTAPSKTPKKRVSFHEDILKNTRTDNIHIEHGFITYKNGRKSGVVAGRYSWCSEGDAASGERQQLHHNNPNDSVDRQVVYRNACSDVLDYGNSEVFHNVDSNYLKSDTSGIFEYHNNHDKKPKDNDNQALYKCSCSSSNSSLDSDEAGTNVNGADKNSNRNSTYKQAKSSSCDCIGMNNTNNNFIGENCYFSEPNINDNTNECYNEPPQTFFRKSVWSKEKKPKSSCLKKTKSRHSNVIEEYDLSTKIKKFNVHDMNQLIDNSKMIFGSLKSIFSIPLPERGVPEGSEDVQSVFECIPECAEQEFQQLNDCCNCSPVNKSRTFLSKSLDGGPKDGQTDTNKFVHNVDDQLRRKNENDLYAPTRQNSDDDKNNQIFEKNNIDLTFGKNYEEPNDVDLYNKPTDIIANDMQKVRNKYIINCESTVFEHTGVSYTYDGKVNCEPEILNNSANSTPVMETSSNTVIGKSLMELKPIKQTFVNIFKTFKETATSPTTSSKSVTGPQHLFEKFDKAAKNKTSANNTISATSTPLASNQTPLERKNSKDQVLEDLIRVNPKGKSISSGSSDKQSICSDTTSNTFDTLSDSSWQKLPYLGSGNRIVAASPTRVFKKTIDKGQTQKHLSSPLRKRSNYVSTTSRFDYATNNISNNRMSPDLFNYPLFASGSVSGRESKNTILSEEFDDILTITTPDDDDDKNDDIVIVDFPESSSTDKSMEFGTAGRQSAASSSSSSSFLKPPKSNLLNRFLRNVTEKKIMESSIRNNPLFANKKRKENIKLYPTNLYVKGVKPKNKDLIEDLNAEIAMEMEMSGMGSPRRNLNDHGLGGNGNGSLESEMPGDISRFELGIGEISIEIFNGNCLHILRDVTEVLMKVFKLYTGYSREGYMTPVLVFLTDKALYVTDLVRNRLCNKLILPYSELDVILMGPYGNTVLLSNESRDMQQVLLAGGPYPADGLVANLEMCARRSGSILPAVGQLSLGHFAPLQAFVRNNSSVLRNDDWLYYAVINMPAGTLGNEQEPLGPNVKGFLMHRRIKENGSGKEVWHAGYFLLKAGVLYMFNDSSQKLPTWAMALAECQGARRSIKAGRPHCFEILLKHDLLQLAAPDEYVASEWLQALVQSASGLFEMQEKHKTLGCTLVMTSNHLITLREDFTSPLRCINKKSDLCSTSCQKEISESNEFENTSTLSSTVSTPSQSTTCASSENTTPTKVLQLFRKATKTNTNSENLAEVQEETSHTNMTSFYGKNSGIEVLTCAAIEEMTGIRIPSHNDSWWCILEFSCQEVREISDDLVIFFASSPEMQRFLRMLEQLWQLKNNDLFPITILDEDDVISEQCTKIYMDINRSWEPLLSAALGYPL